MQERASLLALDRDESDALVGKWAYRAFTNEQKDSAEVNDILLGNGVLTIEKVSKDGTFTGELSIDESTVAPSRWKLRISGSIIKSGEGWDLHFEGIGSSRENNKSPNLWHYEYYGKRFPSNLKFTSTSGENGRLPVLMGQVQRVVPHVTGKIARKLRNGRIKEDDLNLSHDFYPAGFMGSWYAVKQAER